MPIYQYSCPKCDRVWENYHKIAERKLEFCCGLPAAIDLVTKGIQVIEPYYDHGLGCPVTSKGHRKRLMRERHLEEIGDVRDIGDVRVDPPKDNFGTDDEFHETWNRVMKKE